MFVFTAKLTKARVVAIVLMIAVVVVAVVLLVGGGSDGSGETLQSDPVQVAADLSTNEGRISYLKNYGWEVEAEPLDSQEIIIPRELGGVYEEYNRLQLSQGFDLSGYGGEVATRYTYKITNYPSGDAGIVADIIVCRNEVIAGDVQSPELNGFMQGLEMPA